MRSPLARLAPMSTSSHPAAGPGSAQVRWQLVTGLGRELISHSH